MKSVRHVIGGIANLMFKEAYLMGKCLNGDIPDVYVQSDKYWCQYADIIRAKFSEGIKPVDAVALHIRRGDYVNNPFYVNLWETDYYQKALALFPTERFIVFCRDNQNLLTDKADRQWCRDNLDPLIAGRYELPSMYNKEWEDMNLMAGCKAIIGANSSFAWWACYLGQGKKIMPSVDKWYSDGLERTVCPPEWMRI